MKIRDYINQTNKYIEEFNEVGKLIKDGNESTVDYLKLFDCIDLRMLDVELWLIGYNLTVDDEVPDYSGNKHKLIVPSFELKNNK